MEPITWAVLLTLVATKATEKLVDVVSDGAISSAKHLLSLLRQRSPQTAQRLLSAGASGSGEPIVIDAEMIEEVKRVANDDPEVQAAVEATAAAVAADPQGLQTLTKLANEIGVVNLGKGDNIAGDKVAGDKVLGDKVAGDKIGTQIIHQYSGEAPRKLSTPNNLPVSTVSAFVGRSDDLTAVETLLTQNQQVNIAAAVGMGGVGKTELALQFAQRHGDAFPGGVCWLRGVEPIAPQMVKFAGDCLNLNVPEDTEDPVRWCCQRWPGEGLVLIIVDDVQDYKALKPLLPSDSRFRVLLTTRQAILPSGQRLSLEVLMPDAALDLLRSLVGQARIEAELSVARSLCEWVGHLPLGLELVGWHLEQRPGLTIAKLLERLESKRLAAQSLMQTHPEMTATLGVAAAFELSWEPLSAVAKTLAGLLGLFAAAPLAWEWLEDSLRLGLGEMEEESLEEAQAELLKVHFLQVMRLPEQLQYQVHPLVREFFAVKLGDLPEAEDLQRGFAEGMTAIAKTIPQVVTLADRARVTGAVPHLEEVAARWTAVLEDVDKTWCCIGLGRLYQSLSLWVEAERCAQRALEINKTALGYSQGDSTADCYPYTALSLNNLAELYRSQGRDREAEPLLVEALAIRKTVLGDRHPETALSLNNLAELYRSQSCYGEAEPLYVEALAIMKTVLGDRHPSTILILNNLVLLYDSQGRYEEAEPLCVKALEISKAELGECHPSIIPSLNNLAALYAFQGRYGDAEPLYVEALKISKMELGERHPYTATSLNNLASLYRSQNRCEAAEPLYVEALTISKTTLGHHHPSTAGGLFNLAVLYYNTQRHQQALPLIQAAVAIYIPVLGADHPTTQAAQSWLQGIQQAIDSVT